MEEMLNNVFAKGLFLKKNNYYKIFLMFGLHFLNDQLFQRKL